MNSLLEKPNLVSIIILLIVLLLAGGYGVVTYTQRPETNSFTVVEEFQFEFDFSKASTIVDLPKDLEEISGLAFWKDGGQLIAVQDEDGEAYIVDATKGDILEDFSFSKDRDYEGIARNADTVYVLERDGDLHTFVYQSGVKEFDSDKIETDFSYRNDTEGVCYDPKTNSLLIAPKAQELNPATTDDSRRGIYRFDLGSQELSPQPAFYIDEYQVGQLVYGKQGRYTIKPSGVAIDPVTDDIYVLSSVGNILVVLDRESNLKQIELLDKKTFRQPEGICFSPEGDLYISSEGRGGKGIIATLKRQKMEAEKPESNE